jgi:hypothetical protein
MLTESDQIAEAPLRLQTAGKSERAIASAVGRSRHRARS